MANKQISELTEATTISNSDLFVIQQGSTAKKCTGATFLEMVEAHGGISSVTLNSNYTLTITYADGTTWTSTSIRGQQGETGASASVSATDYQADTQGTTVPTGNWTSSIPSVGAGNYLWTRFTWNNGSYSYVVCKYGSNGAGSGDMEKADYDANGTVASAGGIVDYVEANGGKIDHIKVNGTEQTITNKTVDITVPQGTITGITMNGSSKGTSGVVDLGTVITEHQDISGKANTTTVPSQASVSSGVISFNNSLGTQLFTVTLPIYSGGVS